MVQRERPTYLDCAATTPIDPRVRDVVLHYMEVEFGNAGSHTHVFGQEAAKGVAKARKQIASMVNARPEEVVFTSGATESNNLAILGTAEYGQNLGKRHIISTAIEHSAVLQPLQHLANKGFEITLIPPSSDGTVSAEDILRNIRSDTLLISVMHVNNETGIIQPIAEIAQLAEEFAVSLHVDAAQGFGKVLPTLCDRSIDLISVSGHKIHSPKGIGALIWRRSNRKSSKFLRPIMWGGDQERALRPGTLPTHLAAGLGEAAEIFALNNDAFRSNYASNYNRFQRVLENVGAVVHGASDFSLKNSINFRIPGFDSEVIMITLRDIVALSHGSACSSASIKPSHVIEAMTGDTNSAHEACRFSWSHMTTDIPFDKIDKELAALKEL